MDDPTLHDTMQQRLTAYPNTSVVVKATAIILLLGLLQRVLSKPKKDRIFPVWAILEVALSSYVLSGDGIGRRLYPFIRRYSGSLFGLTPGHQVLANFADVDRLMSQGSHIINNGTIQYTLYTRVFGANASPEFKKKFEACWKEFMVPVERLFVNESAVAAAMEKGAVAQRSNSFITFSDDANHMKLWERSANINVIKSNSRERPGAVEADLQHLTRDFGACFSIPLLYGKDFLERNPNLLDDFWKFDNDMFPLLMIGIPAWAPFKSMKEGRAARNRLLDNLESYYHRIDQLQRGEQVDANMSDVSSVPFDRHKIYDRMNFTFQERAAGDLAIFWGQNANTHPLLFWLLVYVYSTPNLLDQLRTEISPHIVLKFSPKKPVEITSMDLPSIFRTCQLLKSCIFETFRMANEATSIRYLEKPLTVPDGTYQHKLQPGTFISAPHAISQRDPSFYPSPDKFIPDRFLETDPQSGKVTARYGKLKPWGAGTSICKGRTFAEREIMGLGAGIIALWDINPVGGTWEIPAMVPGTGVKKPVKDIRVRISRVL